MTTVNERNFDSLVTSDMRREFWRRVKRALREIFGASPDLADVYRKKVEKAPVREQMLAYHGEPLHIAADLAGRDISDDDIDVYRTMFPHPIDAVQPVMTLP